VFLPFLVGHMALALAETGPSELRAEVQQTIQRYQHKLQLSALKRLYKHASNLEPEEILSGGIPQLVVILQAGMWVGMPVAILVLNWMRSVN
jgi:hypothetical protein